MPKIPDLSKSGIFCKNKDVFCHEYVSDGMNKMKRSREKS